MALRRNTRRTASWTAHLRRTRPARITLAPFFQITRLFLKMAATPCLLRSWHAWCIINASSLYPRIHKPANMTPNAATFSFNLALSIYSPPYYLAAATSHWRLPLAGCVRQPACAAAVLTLARLAHSQLARSVARGGARAPACLRPATALASAPAKLALPPPRCS